MDLKQLYDESIRMRFARDQIEAISPALNFVCNVVESHKKTDIRNSGPYNLIRLIESVAELNLNDVKFETISIEEKEALKLKTEAIIADCKSIFASMRNILIFAFTLIQQSW